MEKVDQRLSRKLLNQQDATISSPAMKAQKACQVAFCVLIVVAASTAVVLFSLKANIVACSFVALVGLLSISYCFFKHYYISKNPIKKEITIGQNPEITRQAKAVTKETDEKVADKKPEVVTEEINEKVADEKPEKKIPIFLNLEEELKKTRELLKLYNILYSEVFKEIPNLEVLPIQCGFTLNDNQVKSFFKKEYFINETVYKQFIEELFPCGRLSFSRLHILVSIHYLKMFDDINKKNKSDPKLMDAIKAYLSYVYYCDDRYEFWNTEVNFFVKKCLGYDENAGSIQLFSNEEERILNASIDPYSPMFQVLKFCILQDQYKFFTFICNNPRFDDIATMQQYFEEGKIGNAYQVLKNCVFKDLKGSNLDDPENLQYFYYKGVILRILLMQFFYNIKKGHAVDADDVKLINKYLYRYQMENFQKRHEEIQPLEEKIKKMLQKKGKENFEIIIVYDPKEEKLSERLLNECKSQGFDLDKSWTFRQEAMLLAPYGVAICDKENSKI